MRYPRTFTEHLAQHTDTSDPDGCWEWGGRIDSDGYGRVSMTKETSGRLAHRIAYETEIGAIPEACDVDHVCRTRSCVNPAHLEAVTRQVNLLRRPRLTHCKAGHEYTEANTRTRPSGRRDCRTCDARRTAEYNQRKTA